LGLSILKLKSKIQEFLPENFKSFGEKIKGNFF
jgi:hypothetical protein